LGRAVGAELRAQVLMTVDQCLKGERQLLDGEDAPQLDRDRFIAGEARAFAEMGGQKDLLLRPCQRE